ncbi:hypothetical protein L873DRAFT_1816114 [Choiromyces venosus 120613-1]|uniref:Uncharacterized protein n=1 Tax=Choiromyces venosus 120613-1 TaxID=1336337 RepID=A0A3N4J9M2_9PEZI|nr:hypothetical protein L873DRAFT_1816114 [Choiromyces venosus 120613-1]
MLVLSCLVLSCPPSYCTVHTATKVNGQTRYQTTPYHIDSNNEPCPILPYPILSYPILPYPLLTVSFPPFPSLPITPPTLSYHITSITITFLI